MNYTAALKHRPSDTANIEALPFDTLRARMIATMARPTASDAIIERDWYSERAYRECVAIHDTFPTVTIRTIAGIMATFSATCSWDLNMKATRVFIAHYLATGEITNAVRSGDALVKAAAMLNGANPAETIVKRGNYQSQAWKTLNFYWNILGSQWAVTVDVWMYRMLSDAPETQVRPDGTFYLYLADAIRRVASEFGYTGPQFQAILWTIVRGAAG